MFVKFVLVLIVFVLFEIGLGWLGRFIIEESVMVLLVVFFSVWKILGFKYVFDFVRVVCSIGCVLCCDEVVLLILVCVMLVLWCLGDDDIVVIVVFVVGGCLLDSLDIVVFDVDGSLLVSLRWLICEWMLLSLFYIVEGVVVERFDFVFFIFWLCFWLVWLFRLNDCMRGDELYVLLVEFCVCWVYDLKIGVCVCELVVDFVMEGWWWVGYEGLCDKLCVVFEVWGVSGGFWLDWRCLRFFLGCMEEVFFWGVSCVVWDCEILVFLLFRYCVGWVVFCWFDRCCVSCGGDVGV